MIRGDPQVGARKERKCPQQSYRGSDKIRRPERRDSFHRDITHPFWLVCREVRPSLTIKITIMIAILELLYSIWC